MDTAQYEELTGKLDDIKRATAGIGGLMQHGNALYVRLEILEWGAGDEVVRRCWACRSTRIAGHYPDCALALTLEALRRAGVSR